MFIINLTLQCPFLENQILKTPYSKMLLHKFLNRFVLFKITFIIKVFLYNTFSKQSIDNYLL